MAEKHKTLITINYGLVRQSRPTGGGSGREVDGGRHREEVNPGRDNHGAYRDLGTGRGWKGGKPDRGRHAQLVRVPPLVRLA